MSFPPILNRVSDQIRDEKIQYDINRKAAKILALSSKKIDKYEYLTGNEIIEQAKLYLLSFRKSTWKTNKNNWRSRAKTSWGFKRTKKAVKEKSDYLFFWTSEIQKISDENNYDDLICYFKGPSSSVNFNEFEDPEDIYDKIQNGDKTIPEAEED